ncbi:MAG TPA: aldehyde dehydrogenase (NADP(+)) [Ramlibacter sp.]|nr:aldehyde dehydrogenase (NADP(+)) [Ramlibacter sp.]
MTTITENTPAQIDAAVQAAHAAFATYGSSSAATRAALLRGLADGLEAQRATLVPLADQETGLGAGRLNGEVDRTAFQLRGFAAQVEQGAAFAFTNDAPVPGAPPVGHPSLLRVRVPVGPVAMFSASNFPFAFSVLGGDTAAALAAGCTVVVKAHPAHPALSRAVAAIAHAVVKAQSLPAGVFGMVEGASIPVGVGLVEHPLVAAVAFTGSYRGGRALEKVAQSRPRPIPFYGELGSVNPVIALPAALQAKGAELATTLAASIAMGAGQFCTSPGVIVVSKDAAGDAFVAQLADSLKAATPHGMLSPAIRAGFDKGRSAWAAHAQLKPLVNDAGAADLPPKPFLAQVDASAFIADHALHEEVFGPAAIVVRTASTRETIEVLQAIGGSLTVTVWGADQPSDEVAALVRAASQVAGRVLFAGVPTGVAVTAGQQHGGPFPSSTAPFTTSVGWAALDRFLRPVSLQDAPAWLAQREGVPC